jgi:lipoprotein NlpD
MQFLSLALRSILAAVAAAALAACQTTSPNPPTSQPLPNVLAPKSAATFIRPANGPTLARFDGKNFKGLDIGGHAGDPIVASADGRVVIVSGALHDYGTMIIVKHDETYLTAYAHLQRAIVKEGDVVRQGQAIGEMGRTGTDRVKLHFEIRKKGVAVDPTPYLQGKPR